MARRYSGNEFASVTRVTRCSSSVRTVIADSATAAPRAVRLPGSASGGAPTTAIKGAPQDGSILAIGSASIGAAAGKPKPA